jgi:hypothetical protein
MPGPHILNANLGRRFRASPMPGQVSAPQLPNPFSRATTRKPFFVCINLHIHQYSRPIAAE